MRKSAKKESAPAPVPETPRPPAPPDVPPPAGEDSLEARLAILLEAGIPTVLLTVISREG